jgi:predicted nucleic acid-binding Zn ribbon protein
VAKELDQQVGSHETEHVKRSGLRAFDMALMVAGGVVAVVVAFSLLHFVVGMIWFAVKAVVVVGVVAAIGWMLFRRHA